MKRKLNSIIVKTHIILNKNIKQIKIENLNRKKNRRKCHKLDKVQPNRKCTEIIVSTEY